MSRPVNDNDSLERPFKVDPSIAMRNDYESEVLMMLEQIGHEDSGMCGNPVWMELLREWKARVDLHYDAEWDLF